MKESYVISLDVSTSTIGVAIFKDIGKHGKLNLLHHVKPMVKPRPSDKLEEQFNKVDIFGDFLYKYRDLNVSRVIIEEPLLLSNNIHTVSTLIRYNGMVSKKVYEILKIVPDFISSYDARKFAFPDLMQVRTIDKKGNRLPEKRIKNSQPVLFGAYPYEVDKKLVLWEMVSEIEPTINWCYDKHGKIKKESFDMSDAYIAGVGYMKKIGRWS